MDRVTRRALQHLILPLNSSRIYLPRWKLPLRRMYYFRRHFATPPPMLAASDLPMETYHTVSDESMDSLLESLESLVDSLNDKQYEVEYHSGVLTLQLGDKGTYVINKQPPNKQIWLSSPVSGPKRYEYSQEKKAWFYARDGKTIGALLKEELEESLRVTVNIFLK